jgi:hypothetical protein
MVDQLLFLPEQKNFGVRWLLAAVWVERSKIKRRTSVLINSTAS